MLFVAVFAGEAAGDPATDVAFSNANDRLLSASMRGCSAKILFWGRAGGGERAEAGPLAGACIDLHVTADARARARELHAAAWSCDDTLIFLSTWSERAQEQRLEIYDAFDGARLRRFQAHAGKCFGIAPHPKFPRLLLTGGHDHQVYAWDARLKGVAEHVTRDDAAARAADATGYAPRQRSGTINLPPDRDALIRQENDDDSNVPINRRAPLASDARCSADVWSCSWSPDGTVVAVADLAGQLHLYGPRDSRRAPVPREQYLSTDYSELVWDDHGYAQDIVTGVAPHLAPRAMLQMSAESSLSSVMSSRGPAASSPPPLFDVRDAPHMLPDRLFAARQQPRPLPARDVARLRAARDAQRNAVLAAVDCAAAPSRRAVQVQASRSKLLGADDCAAASAAAVLVAAGRALWPRVRDGAFHDDAYDDADGAAACVGTVTVAAPAAAAGRGGRPRAPGRAGTTPLERIRQNAAASWIDDDEPAPAENDDADDGEDADFAAPLNADDDDESSSDENGDDGDSDHGGRRRAGRRMGRDAGRTTRSSRRLTPPDGDDENVGEERVTRSRRHVGRALGGAAADGAGAADRAGRAAARRAARGNEYDDDDDDALRRTSRLRRSRSDQREEGADEANDDDDDDDEAPPPRRRAAPSRRASEEEEGDNDDDDAPSPRRASDDDDESDFGEHRPRRRGGRAAARPAAPTARSTRSRRRIVDDDEDADGRDDDDAEEEEPVPAPLAAPRPAKVDASVVVRAWACAAAPPARCDAEYQSYTPQRGDAVVYVPEGHAKYARIVGEVDAYAADGGAPPWAVDGSALKALFDAGYGTAFACRVADVEYSLPDKRQFCRSVVATLMLNLEGVPADQNNALCADFEPVAEALRKGDGVRPRATRRAAPEAPALASIRVNVRRCDAPEFVLPRWRYDEAARRTGLYAPGSQARLIFVEGDAVERYAGAVVACRFGPADGVGVPQDALHNLGAGPFVNAAACWERVDIQLVDGDLEHCSPWELEPDEEAYEWDAGPKLDAAQARRLLQVMEAVAASRDADMFRESVENTEAANISRAYLHRVPAPVDLSLMRERLLSGYYRQPEALACDAERLAHNALLYNGERSDDAQSIVATARRVAGALTRVLEPGAATDARVPTEARDCDAHRPARDADARRPAREAEARRPVRAAAAPQRRAAPPPPRSKRRRGGESDDDDDDDHGGGDDDDDDDAPPPRRRAVPSRHESDDSDDNDEPVPPPRPKRGRNAVVEEYDDEDFAPPVLAEQGRRRTRVKKAARRRTGPNLIG
ncbi:hypothetical protein M885DRAFT_534854 [Pelagophyceae sp. CCMP2097]|nr:hypothetical protein M885DRAFT_534854 [Pelagophyceae sp. CCMP2097]